MSEKTYPCEPEGEGKQEGIMDNDIRVPGLGRIVSKRAPLNCIAYALQYGASPVWNARQGFLLWVDLLS